jgi:hypothetical protein
MGVHQTETPYKTVYPKKIFQVLGNTVCTVFIKTSYLSYLVRDSFFGKQPKSKGPDGHSVSRKFLADGIAIDSWGWNFYTPIVIDYSFLFVKGGSGWVLGRGRGKE